MSREIKLRAWDKKNNKWAWPHPFNLQVIAGCNGEALGTKEYGLYFEDIEFIQYTGLKDKNGKEIWEGDIVRTGSGRTDPCGVYLIGGDGIDVVEYDNLRAIFTNTHTVNGLGEIFNHNTEVIGNIYENPELLKEGR